MRISHKIRQTSVLTSPRSSTLLPDLLNDTKTAQHALIHRPQISLEACIWGGTGGQQKS